MLTDLVVANLFRVTTIYQAVEITKQITMKVVAVLTALAAPCSAFAPVAPRLTTRTAGNTRGCRPLPSAINIHLTALPSITPVTMAAAPSHHLERRDMLGFLTSTVAVGTSLLAAPAQSYAAAPAATYAKVNDRQPRCRPTTAPPPRPTTRTPQVPHHEHRPWCGSRL